MLFLVGDLLGLVAMKVRKSLLRRIVAQMMTELAAKNHELDMLTKDHERLHADHELAMHKQSESACSQETVDSIVSNYEGYIKTLNATIETMLDKQCENIKLVRMLETKCSRMR